MMTGNDFIEDMSIKNPTKGDFYRFITMCINQFNFDVTNIDWIDIQKVGKKLRKKY